MKRRDFLSGMSAGLGFISLSNLLPRIAFGTEPGNEKFFVMLYAPNGWDTSLAMAPWKDDARPAESDYFLEYRPDELIRTAHGVVGPAMSPLGKYLEQIRIVNGVFMNATEVGHTSPSIYAMTGNGQGQLSTFSAELDYNAFKMPFGTISSGQVINSGKALNIMSATSLAQLLSSPIDDMIVSESQKETELTRAKLTLTRYKNRMNNFIKIMDTFRANSSSVGEVEAIIASFASGLSCTGFMNLNSYGLDSHSDHPIKHKQNLSEVFSKFSSLLKKFEDFSLDGKDSLLSKTTFMLVSEFTRTPALNASNGKDHNPQANSVVLLGPHINPGITGDTHLVTRAESKLGTSYLAATPVDKLTEVPVMSRQNTMIIRPENVIASVLTSMGLSPGILGTNFAGTRVLKTIMK